MDEKSKKLIIRAARRIWLWGPQRRNALKDAKRGKTYLCAKCTRNFLIDEVTVDHVAPAVAVDALEWSWDKYFERMFVLAAKGLQVLCKLCHKEKTGAENLERRKNKKKLLSIGLPQQ